MRNGDSGCPGYWGRPLRFTLRRTSTLDKTSPVEQNETNCETHLSRYFDLAVGFGELLDQSKLLVDLVGNRRALENEDRSRLKSP